MTREEAKVYFIDSNERIISVAKDENRYNYKTQQIEDVFMRRDFEAKELAIKVLEQEPKTGHWIEDAEQHHVEKTYHCSECGHGAWGEYEKTEYCGGCGAKMIEPQESEDKA